MIGWLWLIAPMFIESASPSNRNPLPIIPVSLVESLSVSVSVPSWLFVVESLKWLGFVLCSSARWCTDMKSLFQVFSMFSWDVAVGFP